MSNSVRPHRQQPTRLPCPWDSPGKSTGVGCHFLLQCMKVKSESEVAQSCPTLSNPMDCSPPGSSVYGIFQARVLEWSAIAFSGLWLPNVKRRLIGKGPEAGIDWGQEKKPATEDEMVGWHHGLDGHELEQTSGDSGGQRSLVCRNPRACKELDTAERLNDDNHKLPWVCWENCPISVPGARPLPSNWKTKHISWALRRLFPPE